MTSVKVKLRKSTINWKEGVLCIQLIHNRKTKLITTRFRLFPSEWNSRLSTAILDSTDENRIVYLQNVMTGLEHEVQQINNLILTLKRRNEYTVNELAEYYINSSFNGYLFPFIQYLVKNLKSDNRTKTASIYETVKRSFSKFRCGEDVMIEKIDCDLMERYENYLSQNNVLKNSSSCYMRTLRAIYNQAVQRGLAIPKNPFRSVYTGIDKTSKRAVNKNIIVNLNRLDLSEYPHLQLARDLFMFSFYTRGMSFVDMANLKQDSVRNGNLVYNRSKTKQHLTVKIENCIKEIIKRYEDLTFDSYLLPIYNEQNQNHISHLRTYNKRLQRLSKILGLEKPLSSYVARHSWATIALRKGISVQVISEAMGHENEKTTRIYLASMEQSIVDDANAQVIAL